MSTRSLLSAALLSLCLLTGAAARPPYQAVFQKTYELKPDSKLARAQCQACHIGMDKKVRNGYGKELARALGKIAATDDEFLAALKKVEERLLKLKAVDLIKADVVPTTARTEDEK